MSAPQRWAVICSTYINAYNIITSLRALNWTGTIVCIKQPAKGTVLAELTGGDVEVWSLALQTPDDLPKLLAHRIAAQDEKIIFFTSERFHEAFAANQKSGILSNARYFIGSQRSLHKILDRHAFYTFLEMNGLAEVPHTIPGSADPWAHFAGPFFIRVKKTWDGLVQTPGVKLVSRRTELQAVEDSYLQVGLNPEDWCYQEALSICPRHNVSICGWHDQNQPLYVATRHLLKHPDDAGNGDITEIIEAPVGLIQTTNRLLNALDYEGPFELEFVLDTASNTYKVIELNPRFWMQHGLVEAVTDHELVRRYVGLAAQPWSNANLTEQRYWVNTIYALFRLLKGEFKVLGIVKSPNTVLTPSLVTAIRYIPRHLINRLYWK